MSYHRKMMARVHQNCRCHQSWSMSPPTPFRNFAENPQIFTLISPSILRSSISHFALYQHPPPDETALKNQKLTPAALGGKQCRWAMHKPVWQERSVCFVSVLCFCGILCCLILFIILIVFKFILF